MSVTTDSQPERGIEEALNSTENRADALFHEVRCQLTEEGLSSEQVLAALAAYRDRFQRAGDEDAEDAVVDVNERRRRLGEPSDGRCSSPPVSLSRATASHPRLIVSR